jgi:hypothetical protein
MSFVEYTNFHFNLIFHVLNVLVLHFKIYNVQWIFLPCALKIFFNP